MKAYMYYYWIFMQTVVHSSDRNHESRPITVMVQITLPSVQI